MLSTHWFSLDLAEKLVSRAPFPYTHYPYLPDTKLNEWRGEASHCLTGVCMKVSLSMSLQGVGNRSSISSDLAALVANSSTRPDKDALSAFLNDHGVTHPHCVEYLSNEDFLSVFGYTDVFESSVASYLFKLVQTIHTDPTLAPEAVVAKTFPQTCHIGVEFFPRLAALAANISSFSP